MVEKLYSYDYMFLVDKKYQIRPGLIRYGFMWNNLYTYENHDIIIGYYFRFNNRLERNKIDNLHKELLKW